MKWGRIAAVLLMVACFTYSGINNLAFAASQDVMAFQARILSKDRTSAPTTSYNFRFKIYESASGGSEVWSENQNSVQVRNGLFTVNLGANTSLGSVNFANSDLYLNIEFDSNGDGSYDQSFNSRLPLSAVPVAKNSQTLGGKSESQFADRTENETITGAYTFQNTLDIHGIFSANSSSQFIGSAAFLNNVTLGNDSGDLISFNGRLGSSIVPNVANTYDLGSATLPFKNIYAQNSVILAGLTEGSVLFAGSMGSISQDNANFKYTDATNSLMIGGNLYIAGITTLATSLTGITKTTAGVVSAATAGVDYLAPAGTLFTMAGTSGSNQTISQGNTLTIAAGTDITTTGGATDTVTIANSSTLATTTGRGATTTTSVALNGGITVDTSNFTVNGTTGAVATASTLTSASLTSGRVTYAGTSGILQDSANMTFGATYGLTLAAGSTSGLQLSSTAGTAVGGILWGTDTNLYRSAANTLTTDDNLLSYGQLYTERALATSNSYASTVTGDADVRYSMNAAGTMLWGDGTNPQDTNLYRSTANTLKTDDSLVVAGTTLNLLTQADLRFYDADSSDYVGFQAPATVSSTRLWTLPDADGGAATVLKTDGSGTLYWDTDNTGGAGVGSLDDAYNSGRTITLDAGPVVINDSGTTTAALDINQSGAITGTAAVIDVDFTGTISNASDYAALDITGVTNAGVGKSIGVNITGFDYSYQAGAEFVLSSAKAAAAVDFLSKKPDSAGGTQFLFNTSAAISTASLFIVQNNGSNKLILSASGDLLPGANNAQDIGSSALKWQDGYFYSTVNIGATLTLSDSAILDTNSALVFQANNDTTNYLSLSSNATDLTLATTDSSILTIAPAGNLQIGSTTTLTSAALLQWGSSAYSSPDTNLYRSAANTLKTDDALIVTGHTTFEGVTSTGATGTGKLVYDGTPTLVTPVLGAATYTTLSGGSITNSALTSGRVTYAGAAGILQDSANMTFGATYGLTLAAGSTSGLQLSSTAGTAAGGILLGTDTNLYRSADNTLKTDDKFIVGGGVAGMPDDFTSFDPAVSCLLAGDDHTTMGMYSTRNGAGGNYNVGGFRFYGRNDAATPVITDYAGVFGRIVSPTAGAETGKVYFTTRNFAAGANKYSRIDIDQNGALWFAGTSNYGTGAADTNLYRSAANTLKTDDSLVVDDELTLNLNGNQAYKFTNRDAQALAIQSQTSGNLNQVEFYSKDGDGTDTSAFLIFGEGTPADITNNNRMQVGYSYQGWFQIAAANAGSGTAVDLYIENTIQDKDILLTTNVGGVQKTLLTLDGSAEKLLIGNATDTNLYRSAANTLQTDDLFTSAGLAAGTINTTAAALLSSKLISGNAAAAITGTTNAFIYRTSGNGSGIWGEDGHIVYQPRDTYDHIFLEGGGTEKMRLTDAGNLGIGTLAGTGNRAVYSTSTGVLTNSSSDMNLKTNVANLSGSINALDVVSQLRGVYYNWLDTNKLGSQREIGMIAQEVQPYLPEVIGTNSDGTLSLDYPKLTAVLIEATKQLKTEVELLQGSSTLVTETISTQNGKDLVLKPSSGKIIAEATLLVNGKVIANSASLGSTEVAGIFKVKDSQADDAELDGTEDDTNINTTTDRAAIAANQIETVVAIPSQGDKEYSIIVTWSNDPGQPYWVTVIDANHFSVKTQNPVAADSQFRYLLIDNQ